VFGAVVAGARLSTHRTNATHNAAAVATVEKARKKKKKKKKTGWAAFYFPLYAPFPPFFKKPLPPQTNPTQWVLICMNAGACSVHPLSHLRGTHAPLTYSGKDFW